MDQVSGAATLDGAMPPPNGRFSVSFEPEIANYIARQAAERQVAYADVVRDLVLFGLPGYVKSREERLIPAAS